MWLGLALKVRKVLARTSAAGGIALDVDGLKAPAPDVTGKKPSVQRIAATGKNLQGFGDLERGNQIDDGAKNTDGVTGLFETGSVRGFEEAGKTRRLAGTDGHCDAVTGHGRGVDPRRAGFDREIVDEQAGFEIVRAVEDQRKLAEEFGDVLGA